MNKILNDKKIKYILIILIFFQLLHVSEKRLIFKKEILYNSFVKNFGSKYIMTPDLLELKEIVTELNLKQINISKKLKQNVFFYQRSVEFLYPVKIINNEKVIFYSLEEKIQKNCEILKEYQYFIMTKC